MSHNFLYEKQKSWLDEAEKHKNEYNSCAMEIKERLNKFIESYFAALSPNITQIKKGSDGCSLEVLDSKLKFYFDITDELPGQYERFVLCYQDDNQPETFDGILAAYYNENKKWFVLMEDGMINELDEHFEMRVLEIITFLIEKAANDFMENYIPQY